MTEKIEVVKFPEHLVYVKNLVEAKCVPFSLANSTWYILQVSRWRRQRVGLYHQVWLLSVISCITYGFPSFDNNANKEVNRAIVRNVQAVSEYDLSLIKLEYNIRYLIIIHFDYDFFKSRKSAHQRKLTGKQEANAATSRRRQRRHNVSGHYLAMCSYITFLYYRRLELV